MFVIQICFASFHPKSVKLSQKQSENGSKLFDTVYNGNNKITELRTILQRESQNS
jgi:hypothetical protein